jgi:hypothetical protein
MKILHMIKERGGLFMTDSGTFSFVEDKKFNPKTFNWEGYLSEYLQWLHDNKDLVFSCCNLDVHTYVKNDVIQYWNQDYFSQLEKDMKCDLCCPPGTWNG